MKIRVAGAQVPVTGDIEANVATILRAIEFAAAEKADVLLTPEGSLSGYTHEFDTEAVAAALQRVTGQAKTRGLGLALGTCFVEPDDGKCYNQIRFYTPAGEYLGFHSKTLTCGGMDEPTTGEVNHFAVRPLRTFELCGVTVGGLVCNDMWANPQCTPMDDSHLSQTLSRMGARILFHAVNGGSRGDGDWARVARRYHEANLRMRAKAGKIWIVTADSCEPVDQTCSSDSGILDPEGEWVLRVPPKGERLFAQTIELEA